MGQFGTGTYSGNTPSATPSSSQTQTGTNYTSLISFATSQHLSETYKQQIKRYGNRMLMGFLESVSAEEALASDAVQWTEEGRLHYRLTVQRGVNAIVDSDGITTANQFTVQGTGATGHPVRVGNTVIISEADGTEVKGLVTNVSGAVITAQSYVVGAQTSTSNAAYDAGWSDLASSADLTLTIYGTEFAKGTFGIQGSLEREYINRENNPTIKKGGYKINGSDATQISWIETFSESGQSNGYLWYHTSELDERERFMDYLETSCLEDVPAANGSTAAAQTGISGSRGLFYELEQYGNVFTGGFDDTDAAAGRADFDEIVKQLNSQAAISEYMLYLNQDEMFAIDNILAQQNGDVGGTSSNIVQGTSFGMFNNDKNMALNLSFDGWRRGGYDFYKTSWKYLNDFVGRSPHGAGDHLTGTTNIQGIGMPGGSSNVYDQGLGMTMKRPYLHMRYRQAGSENRKLKNWVTGSVGGVFTSDEDAMNVHYLSERCLVTQAANNFILFKQS